MAIDFSKRGKMSKREYAASVLGGKKEDYNSDGSPKSGGSSGKSSDAVKAILDSTPGQQKVTENMSDFEKYYTKNKLDEADHANSEALYEPYYQKEIAMQLEDLNAWTASEDVSYERSLRRARISMAAAGAAVGTERTSAEGEMSADEKAKKDNMNRGVERQVGTQNMQNAGYQSAGMNQKGELVDKMQSQVEEGALWYKNIAAQKYFNTQKTYFSSPSPYSVSGETL